MGSLAVARPEPGRKLSGVLVKRNFNYHMLAPSDLPRYTDLSMSSVLQRQSVHYGGSVPVLRHLLNQLAGAVEDIEENRMRIFQCIDVNVDHKIITLEVTHDSQFYIVNRSYSQVIKLSFYKVS